MSNPGAPKGTFDLFYPEIGKWQFLESKIRDFFSRFLFQEIRTPIFEHASLFQRSIGAETEVVQKEMYTFQDKAGRSLTLRPENTASVCRSFLENNLSEKVNPSRFFYIGPMFRYDKPQKGRYRQFHQFGAEIFLENSPLVDAELIYAANLFLKEIGISGIQLQVNSVGCPACRPAFTQKLSEQAQSFETQFCSDCRRKIHTNPLRIFDCKVGECQRLAAQFVKITDFLCAECQSHFQEVQNGLQSFHVDFAINPRLVRGLDYYIRTAFEITSSHLGAQDALLGGGRYDNLFTELGGKAIPGIGFAAGMERIILHFQDFSSAGRKPILVAFQNEESKISALDLARDLWEAGFPVFIDYQAGNMKKQFRRSDRIGAAFTFILGEDEIKNRSVSIKNMNTQEQINLSRENVLSWLKERY